MKKVISVILVLILCIGVLTGCGSEEGIYYMTVDALPETLDPQLAGNEAECIIATNIFMGLFRRDEAGDPQPAACESYKVSADGLIWTFTLKEGLTYRDKNEEEGTPATPVCAADYAFALQRVLARDSASPWAGMFSGIARDEAGNPIAFSTGERSLTIQLIQPDESLPLKLCCPGAMPCQKAFFESCEGTYGLDTKTVLANGAFRISLISEDNGVTLRRIDVQEGYLDKIRLLPRTEEKEQDGLSGSFTQGVPQEATALYHVQTRMFRINPDNAQLADIGVREGLAGVMYRNLPRSQQEGISTAGGLVPDSVLFAGESWRSVVGDLMDEALPQDPVASYREGLAREGRNKLSDITVLVPDTQEWHEIYIAVAVLWQKYLSAYFSVEYLPEEEIIERVNRNDYQLAFYTHRAQDESVTVELEIMADQLGLLAENAEYAQQLQSLQQKEENPENQPAEPKNESVMQPQTALQQISFDVVYAAQTRTEQIEALKKVELTLLANCMAVPMYTVTEYYSQDAAFSHISVSPFGHMLDFAQALWDANSAKK